MQIGSKFTIGIHIITAIDYFKEMDRVNSEFLAGSIGVNPVIVRTVISQLREAGIPMAIVTSSDRKKMQSLYSQYPEFPTLFDKIITGDMVTRAKPDPECFVLGAQQIGVDIKDCIVFEDSRNGLIAARKSGARVIGIATTLSASEVASLSDLTVNAINELTLEKVFH